MKKLSISTLFVGVAFFAAIGTITLSAEGMKCGAGKCGSSMSKPTPKCGSSKKDSAKCGKEKKSSKCGADKKAPKKAMKCGVGKCG